MRFVVKRTLLCISFFLTLHVWASTPEIVRYSTYMKLEAGKAKGISILQNGELTLSPKIKELFDTGEPITWCAGLTPQQNIIVGTGNDGKVFSVDKNGSATLLFDADDPEVYALVTSTTGEIYVATSPSAQIFKISPAGEIQQLADLFD